MNNILALSNYFGINMTSSLDNWYTGILKTGKAKSLHSSTALKLKTVNNASNKSAKTRTGLLQPSTNNLEKIMNTIFTD